VYRAWNSLIPPRSFYGRGIWASRFRKQLERLQLNVGQIPLMERTLRKSEHPLKVLCARPMWLAWDSPVRKRQGGLPPKGVVRDAPG